MKAVAKAVKRMCRRSSHADGHKTKAVRRTRSWASMVARWRQWKRRWEGCADEALTPMAVRRRQWQRQWEECEDEAFALMATRRRQRQRQWEECAGGALTLMANEGSEKVAQKKHSHQCSRDKGQWDGYADEAYKPGSRDDKRTAVAWIYWTPRSEGQDATTCLKLMLGSCSANFYDLHRVNQVIQQKKIKKIQRQAQERIKKRENACYSRMKRKELKKKKWRSISSNP